MKRGYVEIRYEEFKSLMDNMRFKEIVVEGAFERTWSFDIGSTPYEIRIYSSICLNTNCTRQNGKDAIRCMVWNKNDKRGIYFAKRINRTVSALQNVRERCRELWLYVKNNRCSCGNGILVDRKSKVGHIFKGCTDYPLCKNTSHIQNKQLKLKFASK